MVTVDAILDATLQVLLAVGKERLTTTRVAARAGVSVGTLYQYFPNKISLLQAALKRHMDSVYVAIERVCTAQHGNPLGTMAVALVDAYFAAKMKDSKVSAALYAVSSDVDGLKIAQTVSNGSLNLIAALLATSSDPLSKDPLLVASMLVSAMAGVSRRLLESGKPPKNLTLWRDELTTFLCAYLKTCHIPNLPEADRTLGPSDRVFTRQSSLKETFTETTARPPAVYQPSLPRSVPQTSAGKVPAPPPPTAQMEKSP